MNRNYIIELKEQSTFSKLSKLKVYLLTKNIEIDNNSLFRIKLGYIDLEEDDHKFYCFDSSRMTLDIMKSIVSSWEQWNMSRDRD